MDGAGRTERGTNGRSKLAVRRSNFSQIQLLVDSRKATDRWSGLRIDSEAAMEASGQKRGKGS